MIENKSKVKISPAVIYYLACFLLWVLVDLGTAGGFGLSYSAKYGPTLLIFYLGYPLVFTFLVYTVHWGEKKLLLATLVAIFIVEVIFTRNPLVMTFPVCLLGIPLAILIYAPLTYFPLWYVRKEMGKHKAIVVFLVICELAVMGLTTFGNSR
ncbi:MAG: hypothetical protein ABIJ39_06825 [Chloroflexota bacterium]